MSQSSTKLGKIIVDAGLVTEDQVKIAMDSKNSRSLLRTLVEMGYATETDIASVVAKSMNLPYLDISDYQIDTGAATIISEELARRYHVLPIGFDGDRLIVATADPENIFAIDDLRIVTGYDINVVVCTETDLVAAIGRFAQFDRTVEEVAETVDEEVDIQTVRSEKKEAKEAPIVKLVNLIISDATQDRANDIHIEPQEKDLRIRYRVDGVLHEVMRVSKQVQPGMTARIKIIAGMDIAERRIPQDGRFGLTIEDKTIDFRAATLPTIHGEKIVLRLLEKETVLRNLEDLGFLEQSLEVFKFSFLKPYGAILITGPTGSGKTTTLYAALNILNTPEKNIITVEDPVEYRLPGINQVQVNARAGMTFAAGLRSILRNDPDIVMIGEIRDRETALISVESALTGHLVISTLHTNDAASAITRLTEMGVEPFLTSSAVDCVVAQRLARKLCKNCRKPYTPSAKSLQDIDFPFKHDNLPTLYKAQGCSKCSEGYKGRIGVYEVLAVSETIERLTVERSTADEIKKVAVSEGMITLRNDGYAKVQQGITSIEEIMRVIA